MSALHPKLAFTRMTAAPPSQSIQFYDGYFTALKSGNYTINLSHTVTPPEGQAVPPYALTQAFVVQGPEFTIDPTTVQSQFPPNGASDIYDQQLTYLVLSDPSLPWERGLVPGTDEPGDATPWLALVLFAESELTLPPGSDTPVVTCTVAELLTSDPDTLKPSLPAGWVSPDVLQTQCQTVTIPGATFQSVMPQRTDLPLLAHCRAVNVPDEPQVLLSVVLGNRLPLAFGAPVKYYAHLVSLEGFAAYLGPGAQPLPTKTGLGQTGLMDVQLVSLFNWSFVSMPESGANFEQLIEGLIQSETATPALALPVPDNTNGLPASALSRLQEGYVALDFVTGSGEQSFAWYRGPFTARPPRPLPPVGDPAVPIAQAGSADALMIYLAEQGLFDLSYSAAWMIGRALALADGSFSQAVQNYRRSATDSLTTLAQRMAMPHFAGETDMQALLAPDATRRRFARLAAQGLPERLTELLSTGGMEPAHAPARRRRRRRALGAIHPRTLLAQPEVMAAVSDNVAEDADPVAAWLANLALLYPVPFSHLVPDARMLPVESVRFFYVDRNWLEALQAGALSIAIHSSSDVALQQALSPQLTQATARHRQQRFARTAAPAATYNVAGADPTLMTGILIRSGLVSGWPSLVVTASAGGVALNVARDSRLSGNVRLCLFEGVPDTVTLAEPYQGLRFGIEDNGIALRDVTTAGQIGMQITDKYLPADSSNGFQSNGVVNTSVLASALASALGVNGGLGAGDFAIQIIKAPEMQQFKS